jgi:glycosyltransferase involved in cell wall biosynthesis
LEKGRALRARAENEYSWKKIAEQHLDLYKKIDSGI